MGALGGIILRSEMPVARSGQRIGLLGGSFDPAHGGHVHVTREALKRFGLDRVWWLVSPGNPLKLDSPAALERRLDAARKLMSHPRVRVTALEKRLGTRYTAETLTRLVELYPGVRFVWLMGADNLATLHHWQQWRRIIETVPIGVIARPGDRISARTSKAADIYRMQRLSGRQSRLLPLLPPPVWCFVNVPMVNLSSSAIRARGDWVR